MYIDISQRKWRKNGQKIISYKSSRILFGNKGSGSKKEEVTFSGKFSFSLILDFSFPDLSLSILSDKSSSSLKGIWSINCTFPSSYVRYQTQKKGTSDRKAQFSCYGWGIQHYCILFVILKFTSDEIPSSYM